MHTKTLLEAQVAVVTGGTRGIGRAVVESLARAGARVVLTGRNASTAEETAGKIAADCNAEVTGVGCDISIPENCVSMVKSVIDQHEKINTLVLNAGITRDGLLARMKEEDWQVVLDTNLTSAYHCAKAALRPMTRARKGKIIAITSVVGLSGNAGQCNYAASKAGLVGFCKSLAREYGSRGITVNCIAPGFIETDMTETLPDGIRDQLKQQIPLGRLGRPEDVASAVLFLASSAGDYITGSVLQVDGGMAM
jgi:3-oxoacyl-[acyl-carrier protein] reductase